MRLVAERSQVPVPAVRWLEPASAPLGASFFVMERADGVAAPDVMPYVFGSWLSEASPADQAKVQQRSVEILCGIHAVEATDAEQAFLELDEPGATPLRRHVAGQKSFYEWGRRGRRFPVVERLFRWLDENWPERESGSRLCWGDARIGNVLWHDFAPVAVLDWECAAVAPREFDLGWLIFFHRYFQDYAEQANVPGMPGFLRRDDVAEAYAAASGHEPRNLDWYLAYAALRQALVSIRTSDRQIHFGERPAPEDPEDLIQQCAMLERILDGTQEWK
jgi:aminoglycoside phosphotransferase (APT) family kinase protein